MAKVVVLGDIKTKGQAVTVDPLIKKICCDSNFVIANLEGPVIFGAKPRKDKLGSPLASDNSIASLTESLSVSVLTFGNNHILDFGVEGLNEAIDFVEGQGIEWVGASNGEGKGSHVLINEELKIALLSFAHREGPVTEVNSIGCGPFALPEFDLLLSEVQELSANGFAVFVSYHGGEEFFNTPWPRRVAWAKSLTEAGAFLVFGQHSHSVQPVYATGKGTFIAPGLGNTYFETPYQKSHTGTERGLLLVLDTVSKTLVSYHIKAKWDDQHLSLASEEPKELVPLNTEKLVAGWAADCRQQVFGNRLNVKAKPGQWWRGMAVSCFFALGVARSKFKNVRDVDILLGALPVIGPILAKRALESTGKEFKY